MSTSSNRKILQRTKIVSTLVDYGGLLSFALFFCHFLPLDILRNSPASGGDTGSHFWPLYTLVHYGIPFREFPVWNPGNNGGEPQLLHYFPLPFFLMALLHAFFSLGMSFNIGTLLPMLLLPLSVYTCVRLIGMRFPAPIIAAASSLPFLYNESYSMWGGNALSNLAGQFAHGYALCLLLLATGSFCWELRRDRFPIYSTVLFCGVVISHAYVAIAIPLLLLAIALFYPFVARRCRIVHGVTVAVWLPLLTAWFVIPLITNQRWTTAMPMLWGSKELVRGAVPPVLYPVFILLLVSLAVFRARRKKAPPHRTAIQNLSYIWASVALAYLALFFIFPKIGLVDIRAVPQIQLSVCILAGIFAGAALRSFKRSIAVGGAALLCLTSICWSSFQIEVLPHWMQYNYSGWSSKPAFADLSKLYTSLRGGFSDPRVIYEHSDRNEVGGSLRVFELLPYFANRATLESVYTQSTILAPATYFLQSEVSETPSCPLNTYSCGKPDIADAEPRLRLMGVSQIIAVTPKTIRSAESAKFLRRQGTFGQWQLFGLSNPPQLVEMFNQTPGVSKNRGWKEEFYNWFRNFTGAQRFLLAAEFLDSKTIDDLQRNAHHDIWKSAEGTCHPKVSVSFQGLQLTTDCPGKAHLLKFAFHPSWKTNNGDPLFLVSPGMLGIIPTSNEVHLSFGHSSVWTIARGLSAGACIAFCFAAIYYRRRKLTPKQKPTRRPPPQPMPEESYPRPKYLH